MMMMGRWDGGVGDEVKLSHSHTVTHSSVDAGRIKLIKTEDAPVNYPCLLAPG